jgi:hypothetical protein
MFIFASIHSPHSLNQGQGSVFMLRECAESISPIKLPLRMYFLQKFSKKFFRRSGHDFYPYFKIKWRVHFAAKSLEKKFLHFLKIDLSRFNFMREIDCTNFRCDFEPYSVEILIFNTEKWYNDASKINNTPESETIMYFYASGMCAIDFSHKITSRKVNLKKFLKKFPKKIFSEI